MIPKDFEKRGTVLVELPRIARNRDQDSGGSFACFALRTTRSGRQNPRVFRLLSLVILFGIVPLLGIGTALGASPPQTSTTTTSPGPANQDDGVSEPYASQTGKFGLSIMFQYDVLQTPAPIKLFQNGVGGGGELSYGISRGIRLLGGLGYLLNTPHVAPPLHSSVISGAGPSNQYLQAYLGAQLELTRWIPQMIRYQPWFPYLRADTGGVFPSFSDAGPQTGHPDGLLEDIGIGIEGRPRAIPMAFFGEVRSQWLFLGSQVITVIPILAGTTFYF